MAGWIDGLVGKTRLIGGALADFVLANRVRFGSGLSVSYDSGSGEATVTATGGTAGTVGVQGNGVWGRVDGVTLIDISAPIVGTTGTSGDDTYVTLGLAQQPVHTPVDCVILKFLDSAGGSNRVLPTADQADGVTMTTGMRCLMPYDSSELYLYEHNGSVLIPASDSGGSNVAHGHTVSAKSGRIYGGKAPLYFDAYNESPYARRWCSPDGPAYAVAEQVTASSTLGWVELRLLLLPNTLGREYDVRVLAWAKNAATGATRRFDRTMRFVSTGTGMSVVRDDDTTRALTTSQVAPVSIAEPGETDSDARLRVTANIGGPYTNVRVSGLRDAAGGTNYFYRAEIYVHLRKLT